MPRLIEPVVTPGAMAAAEQPGICDEGLELRPWERADVPVVTEAFADPEIQRWHFRTIETAAEAADWIDSTHRDWASETAATWAVCASGNGEVFGRITLDPKLAAGHGEVSYWVLPGARRRHVATRAVVALTHWAHHELGLQRVELKHSTDNPHSCLVASAAGFTAEGTIRRGTLHADGWHDMHLHSHLMGDDG